MRPSRSASLRHKVPTTGWNAGTPNHFGRGIFYALILHGKKGLAHSEVYTCTNLEQYPNGKGAGC